MDLSNSQLYLQGSLIPAEVASGEYWRLLTAGFLHGSLIHIATNMLSLYLLGIPLERILGRWPVADHLPAQPARLVGQRVAVQRTVSRPSAHPERSTG